MIAAAERTTAAWAKLKMTSRSRRCHLKLDVKCFAQHPEHIVVADGPIGLAPGRAYKVKVSSITYVGTLSKMTRIPISLR